MYFACKNTTENTVLSKMLLPSLDVKDILLIASAYFSDMTKILFLNLFVVLYVKEFRKNKNKNMVIDVFVIIVA